MRDLTRLSAVEGLLPDIGSSPAGEQILQRVPGGSPPKSRGSDRKYADRLKRSAHRCGYRQLAHRNRATFLENER